MKKNKELTPIDILRNHNMIVEALSEKTDIAAQIHQLQNPPDAPATLIFKGKDTGIKISHDPGGARMLIMIEDGGLSTYLRFRDQYGIRLNQPLRDIIEKILLEDTMNDIAFLKLKEELEK